MNKEHQIETRSSPQSHSWDSVVSQVRHHCLTSETATRHETKHPLPQDEAQPTCSERASLLISNEPHKRTNKGSVFYVRPRWAHICLHAVTHHTRHPTRHNSLASMALSRKVTACRLFPGKCSTCTVEIVSYLRPRHLIPGPRRGLFVFFE